MGYSKPANSAGGSARWSERGSEGAPPPWPRRQPDSLRPVQLQKRDEGEEAEEG